MMHTDVTKYLVFIVYYNYYEQVFKIVSWNLIFKRKAVFLFSFQLKKVMKLCIQYFKTWTFYWFRTQFFKYIFHISILPINCSTIEIYWWQMSLRVPCIKQNSSVKLYYNRYVVYRFIRSRYFILVFVVINVNSWGKQSKFSDIHVMVAVIYS